MAGVVDAKSVLRAHAGHHVDHRGDLRDVEIIGDGGGCEFKPHGAPGGDDEVIDGGDVLLGIDENPLPVRGDDIDVQRRCRGAGVLRVVQRHRVRRIDGEDAGIGAEGEDDDDDQGNSPHRQFQREGVGEGWVVGGGTGFAVAQREHHGEDGGGDDDEQHHGGVEDGVVELGVGDRAGGVEEAVFAAA